MKRVRLCRTSRVICFSNKASLSLRLRADTIVCTCGSVTTFRPLSAPDLSRALTGMSACIETYKAGKRIVATSSRPSYSRFPLTSLISDHGACQNGTAPPRHSLALVKPACGPTPSPITDHFTRPFDGTVGTESLEACTSHGTAAHSATNSDIKTQH